MVALLSFRRVYNYSDIALIGDFSDKRKRLPKRRKFSFVYTEGAENVALTESPSRLQRFPAQKATMRQCQTLLRLTINPCFHCRCVSLLVATASQV